jgi:ribosomal protein S18 acetylase RimI-like enzyme
MLNVTVERSTDADAEALTRVQVEAFHSDARTYPGVAVGGPPGYDSVERVREKIRDHACYTIRHGERIIGGMVVFDRGAGQVHLDLLSLDPDYHNRGVGTRAMRFLERAHPAATWSLDTPSYAVRNHHFYEKLGYVRVGEGDRHDKSVAR